MSEAVSRESPVMLRPRLDCDLLDTCPTGIPWAYHLPHMIAVRDGPLRFLGFSLDTLLDILLDTNGRA
jgi:hypothetical protein